jgi:hypothetical protein
VDDHLAVLQWLWANGVARAMTKTARSALRWRKVGTLWCCNTHNHVNGYDFDGRTSSYAATFGHLAVLQWLRANDCDCDWPVYIAARYGHLEVLQ